MLVLNRNINVYIVYYFDGYERDITIRCAFLDKEKAQKEAHKLNIQYLSERSYIDENGEVDWCDTDSDSDYYTWCETPLIQPKEEE